ncbi:hypothetical protein RvY_07952 [Ramazzottius varieornatus]|uniref:Uncharacterized protein n=1 Tax=Ramazzottius varieornatus TaxID=947166 RepID=A0A1D1V478_RAMVA|nr:hypothetical protein RvY_07952 [Ramazzottius varieornatus]
MSSHHSHHDKSKTVTTTTTGIHLDEIHAPIPPNFPPAERDFNELNTPPGFHYAPILENPLTHHDCHLHTDASVAAEKPAHDVAGTPLVQREYGQEVTADKPPRTSEPVGEFVKVGNMKSVRTENEIRIGEYLNDEVKRDNVQTMAEIQESPTNLHSELLQQIRDTGPIAAILPEQAARPLNRPLKDDILKREAERVELERARSGQNLQQPEIYQWTDRTYEEMLPENTEIKSRRTFVEEFGAAREPPMEANQDYTKLAYGVEMEESDKKPGMEFAIAGTGFLDKQKDDNEKEEESGEDKGVVGRAVDTVTAAAGAVAGFITSHLPGATTADSTDTVDTIDTTYSTETTEKTVDVPEEHHTSIVESVSAAAGTVAAAAGAVAGYISAHMPSATTTDTSSSEVTEKTTEVEVTATNVPEEQHAGIVESVAAAAGTVAGFISAHLPHAATTETEQGITEVTEEQGKGLVDSAMDKITSFFTTSTAAQETEEKEGTEEQKDENGDAATDITEVTEVETTFTEALEQEQEPGVAQTEENDGDDDHDDSQEGEHTEVAESATMSTGAAEQTGGVEGSQSQEVKKKSKHNKKKHGK